LLPLPKNPTLALAFGHDLWPIQALGCGPLGLATAAMTLPWVYLLLFLKKEEKMPRNAKK